MNCIYCKQTEDAVTFNGVEHVVPQSFGRFGSETPTLGCVCDDCNSFFGRELDQVLARDTWEGITRYRHNIRSGQRRPLRRLQLTLGDGDETGELAGAILGGVDGTTGQLLPPVPQFHIYNNINNEHDIFLLEEIPNIDFDENTYGRPGERKTKIIAGSQEDHDAVIEALQEVGVNYQARETFGAPFAEGLEDGEQVDVPIHIQGTVDNNVKRGLVKVLINFAAFYIGANEILKPEWDNSREYVRRDTEPINGRMLTDQFWGDETDTLRLPDDSINILIENKRNVGVVGRIQFYNLYTYEFILVEEYYIPAEHEIAARFTPGQPPQFAEKRLI